MKISCLLLLFLVPWSHAVCAQEPNPTAALKPGTMIKARLAGDLSSSATSKGDFVKFTILFATDEGKRVALPRESKLCAKVVAAKSALRERAGFVTLSLDHIEFPDGKSEPVRGDIQFMTLKDITVESTSGELTLQGRVEESEKMTVQSSTSTGPPPANASDVEHADDKSPERRRATSTGTIDLTKKKGHDVDIPTGTVVNVRILEPLAPAPPKPSASPSTHGGIGLS
jgi:hypothetical protein